MKRKVFLFLLASTMLMTACGSDKGTSSSNDSATETPSETSDTSEKETTGNSTLTIYSPQADTDRGPWIKDRIKEDLGINVEFLCAAGADLSERLIAEKSNPQADIIMGLVQTSMYQLKDQDILTPYVPTWADGLPEVYKEKDGYFNSFWQTPIVIAYNGDYLSNPPAKWSDLVKPEYKELFNIGNTSSQTTRTYLIGMLWDYYDESTGDISEEGWDFLRQLYANSRTLPATDTDIWQLMSTGEMPIQLNWFGGIKKNCESNNIPVQYVTPEAGTPIVAEAIGIVNGSDNEELAKQFVDWWGSAEVMSDYANEFGQAPAHPDAISLCNDSVKSDAQMFTAQDIDWEVASSKLDEWFEKIELEIMP